MIPRRIQALVLTTVILASAVPAVLASRQAAIDSVRSANQVFTGKVAESQKIPKSVLEKAVAIAIIPNVIKAGFILGGTRGAGVLVAREPSGKWSNPAFVTLTGGSVGLQVGAQSSDVIMIFNTKESLEKVLAQDFSLGGSVSGSAGPTGANPVTASSTIPDVYTYVRNREGLFGGVSLQGIKLAIDDSRNVEFYNQPGITARQILAGETRAPEAASLRQTLDRYAPAP